MLARRITPVKKGDSMYVQVSGGVALTSCPGDGFIVHTTLSDSKETTPVYVPSVMLMDASRLKKKK